MSVGIDFGTTNSVAAIAPGRGEVRVARYLLARYLAEGREPQLIAEAALYVSACELGVRTLEAA